MLAMTSLASSKQTQTYANTHLLPLSKITSVSSTFVWATGNICEQGKFRIRSPYQVFREMVKYSTLTVQTPCVNSMKIMESSAYKLKWEELSFSWYFYSIFPSVTFFFFFFPALFVWWSYKRRGSWYQQDSNTASLFVVGPDTVATSYLGKPSLCEMSAHLTPKFSLIVSNSKMKQI